MKTDFTQKSHFSGKYCTVIFHISCGCSYIVVSHIARKTLLFLRYRGLNSGSSPWTMSHSPFCNGFFEIQFCELFDWCGFEPQSSWSLPTEQLG
jgi:hypothetical protein